MQDEVYERFIPLFANMLDKRLRWKLFTLFIGGQSVLGKRVVELIDNYKKGGGVER